MANKDDYLTEYRAFFEEFANTVEPNDQLPVKLGSYKFINSEVVGGIIDWCLQYLNRKSCPSTLIGPLVKITIDEIRQACKKNPVGCGFNPNENVYEPLKLMQTVMCKMNEICLRYLDNSQLDTLPCPSTLRPPKVSICSSRNTRRRMEDRHVVIHDVHSMFNIPDTSPASYYAIFDGHAGSDAAAYSAAHLHQYLVESAAYPSEPELALKEAFLRTDECFLEKSRIENFRSGTTAVCALLNPKQETLYVAWVGDSQALLVNRGKVLQIVKPHKPCREDEKDRIEANGGCVMFWGMWRVNGQLAVSRAIGDIKLKPYVTAEPDIVAVPLDGNEEFLIMACDGLWDFVSEDDAAIAVYKKIKEDPENIDNVAESLSELAKQEGSRDNISIIIIFLKDPVKIAKNISSDYSWLSHKQSNDVTMETGVDNTLNNTASNNFDLFDVFQKRSNLDHYNDEPDFKANGNEANKNDLFLFDRPANGKRPADFDDDDLGPETDVDAVDEMKFGKIEKMEILDVQRAQSSEFEPIREQREETPTPPADSVLDSSGVTDNVAESEESEDEWNYYKVDQKENPQSLPSDISNKASSPVSCPDEMSQLNPDAKEFIPVSPTRVSGSPSPFPRDLGDELIAQSPRRAVPMDISVPSPIEFQCEVKQRPSELFDEFENQKTEQQNGHQLSSQEIMQNLLNGKDVSEIEFHPQNFTPSELIENSKENLTPSEENPTNSSLSPAQDEQDFANFVPKEQDPMSMSFYQDKNEGVDFTSNPFDLNKVQLLPDNIDEFIQPANEKQDNLLSPNEEKEHISPAESPLGVPLSPEVPEVQQIDPEVQKPDEISLVEIANSTDIPKQILENLESPQSPILETIESPSSPIVETMEISKSPITETMEIFKSPTSPVMETMENEISPVPEVSQSPLPEISNSPNLEPPEVCELSRSPILEPPQVCELSRSPNLEPPEVCELSRSPVLEASPSPVSEVQQIPVDSSACEVAKSPLLESSSPLEVVKSPTLESPVCEMTKSPLPVESPVCEMAKSPLPVESPVCENAKSPLLESPYEVAKSPILESPVCEMAKSPLPVESPDNVAKSTLLESNLSEMAKSPLLESSPVPETPKSPVMEIPKSPVMEEAIIPKSPVMETSEIPRSLLEIREPSPAPQTASPLPEVAKSPFLEVQTPVENSPIGPLSPKSPIPELTGLVSPDITASIKDDNISGEDGIKSPIQDLEDVKSPVQEIMEAVESQKIEEQLQISSTVEESKVQELISDAIQDIMENKNLQTDFEEIQKVEEICNVSVLESVPPQSPLPEVQSPLSPSEEVEKFQTEAPESWKQNVEITCDIIKPEFAVATIASPCEESKSADTPPPIPAVEVTEPPEFKVEPEPQKIIEKLEQKPKSTTKTLSKKPSSSPTKPSLKSTTTTTSTLKKTLTPSKPSPTPKRTTTTPTPRVPSARTTPKSDKKPLTNGDLKPQIKTTSLMKKSTTAKPSPTAPKTTLSKPPTRPTTTKPPAPKTAACTTTRPLSAAAKPKPSGLAPKTTAAPPRAASRPSTTSTTKPSTTTLKPKPPSTTTGPKPRVTTTVATKLPKAPDTEKQIKETANKQISATKPTANKTSTARTTSTVKKTDNKSSLSSRTTTARTTTTRPISKKPSEVTKTTTTVTKTKTAISKPQQNGVVSVIQDITTSTTIEEPSLVKDNSPTEVDNNQLVEI